jgi:isopenicillin N synthase-like dioxygenase
VVEHFCFDSQTTSPTLKPQFIKELQHALINVGFLYLSNVPVKTDVLVAYIRKMFYVWRVWLSGWIWLV